MKETALITFWNRYTQKNEVENVYGDTLIRWLYQSQSGRMASPLLARPAFSKLAGLYQNSPLSVGAIKGFIRKFEIPMDSYESGPFRSFNRFFIRRFRDGQRPFEKKNSIMPAFAEGRYLGFTAVSAEQVFPVKGDDLDAARLLGDEYVAKDFSKGPLLIARLCPVDYHRFHFPDDGRVDKFYTVAGNLHSVNPLALKFKGDIFATNERQVSILKTNNFGKLAYVEVGAFFVGKIVQTFAPGRETGAGFKRGDEKGYFLFGGSTVIVLGEPGAWKPSDDILAQTSANRETYVHLGDHVARSTVPGK